MAHDSLSAQRISQYELRLTQRALNLETQAEEHARQQSSIGICHLQRVHRELAESLRFEAAFIRDYRDVVVASSAHLRNPGAIGSGIVIAASLAVKEQRTPDSLVSANGFFSFVDRVGQHLQPAALSACSTPQLSE